MVRRKHEVHLRTDNEAVIFTEACKQKKVYTFIQNNAYYACFTSVLLKINSFTSVDVQDSMIRPTPFGKMYNYLRNPCTFSRCMMDDVFKII